jgi:hypothetical protein
MAKRGRPSTFTPELAAELCKQLALGRSLRSVCKDKGMPDMSTVFDWMRVHESFANQYARAKEESADALFEETIDIADDSLVIAQAASDNPKLAGSLVQAQRLRVDTRKWMMSKMKPKKYGEKLDLTSDGKALPTPIYSGNSKSEK